MRKRDFIHQARLQLASTALVAIHGTVGARGHESMIVAMRRVVHTALGCWFLIAMTMTQGCADPAQTTATRSARDANMSSSGSQFAFATAPQNSRRGGLPPDTTGYVGDPDASKALTDYLKHQRLPLVGAQVLRNPNDGNRSIVLYGFVGSDFGRSDAERKTDDFINDPSVEVDNRIRVNPDLLAAGASSPRSGASSSTKDTNAQPQSDASIPGVQSYVEQQNQAAQIQQYQQQNSMTSMSSILPLVALLGMLSMANGGGNFSTGPSFGYSPFGNSPYGGSPYGYSPYSSYATPGMPPTTFGSPNYGYSPPGGVAPFGTLPGSPYGSFP